ncbi:phenylalanine--tRNA ligase subunit beta, partial [Lactobacillus sp. XV13L]|nr:phenylalanine--tRNA ligase subunit beta [Lactobacillus sp. XV13L]
LTLLNNKKVDLDPSDIVITNGDQVVMMAGVMGGLNSEIVNDTTDVLLESAVFDPTLIRKAALRHANRTEASSRYEKGVNWDATRRALDMAALLLRNEANGQVASGVVTASDEEREPVVIKTTVSYVNHVLGTEIAGQEMMDIFCRLNFQAVQDGDNLTVNVLARR